MFGSILQTRNTAKRIFLNAGHFNNDPGIVTNGIKEADEVKKIRDLLTPMLRKVGLEVIEIPDNLNLRESIDFVNTYVWSEDMGLAIDIHLNYVGAQTDCTLSGCPPSVSGVEVYSGDGVSEKAQAGILSEVLANKLKLPNRGWKSQRVSAFGTLAWVNQVKCWSHIIECLYLSNYEDLAIIKEGKHHEIADGILAGIMRLYNIPPLINPDIPVKEEELKISLEKKIVELKAQVVALLQKLIAQLKSQLGQ